MFDLSRFTDLIGNFVAERNPAEVLEQTPLAEVLERAGLDASLAEGWVPSNLLDNLQGSGLTDHLPQGIAEALEQLGVDPAAEATEVLQGKDGEK